MIINKYNKAQKKRKRTQSDEAEANAAVGYGLFTRATFYDAHFPPPIQLFMFVDNAPWIDMLTNIETINKIEQHRKVRKSEKHEVRQGSMHSSTFSDALTLTFSTLLDDRHESAMLTTEVSIALLLFASFPEFVSSDAESCPCLVL